MFRTVFVAVCLSGLVYGTENFDSLSNGDFTEHAVEYGTLTAQEGHAAIDKGHGRSGEMALHIKGGDERSATLNLAEPLEAETPCDFYLERWTRADPFSFTVSADGQVVHTVSKLGVGRYAAHVTVNLPAGTQAVTFTCTSAEKGGALIDDITIHNGPMEIKAVDVENPGAYPIMKRARFNPAVRVKYTVQGSANPKTPGTISFKVTPGTLSKVTLRSGDMDGIKFDNSTVYGSAVPMEDGRVTIKCEKPLVAGEANLWVDATPSDAVKVGKTVKFSDFSVKVEGVDCKVKNNKITQRVGYMLAMPGDPVGKQTSGEATRNSIAFRIPGMIRTRKGTLIGCFDARYTHGGDLCADIDVATVRSTDGGQTWSMPEVALDAGPGAANGCGDPAIVQDKKGRIWIQALACHFPGGASLWTSKKGNDPKTTGQWEMTYSDDDGVTWSKDIVNPTKSIKKDAWHCILAGPGCAITKKDGTIVFPAQIWQNDLKPHPCRSTICYSKDNGKTWVMGEGIPHRTSECQVVELADGSLMLNCRNEARSGKRVVYVTKDMGKTWTPHSSNLNALQEPTCQASLISIGGNKLLFSNPKSGRRDHMTIRYSADGGKTWNEGLEYDTRGCAGYSCLAMVDKDVVGVIYEGCFQGGPGGNNTLAICFLRIPLKNITSGK